MLSSYTESLHLTFYIYYWILVSIGYILRAELDIVTVRNITSDITMDCQQEHDLSCYLSQI